jgi:hypothetical protein
LQPVGLVRDRYSIGHRNDLKVNNGDSGGVLGPETAQDVVTILGSMNDLNVIPIRDGFELLLSGSDFQHRLTLGTWSRVGVAAVFL